MKCEADAKQKRADKKRDALKALVFKALENGPAQYAQINVWVESAFPKVDLYDFLDELIDEDAIHARKVDKRVVYVLGAAPPPPKYKDAVEGLSGLVGNWVMRQGLGFKNERRVCT